MDSIDNEIIFHEKQKLPTLFRWASFPGVAIVQVIMLWVLNANGKLDQQTKVILFAIMGFVPIGGFFVSQLKLVTQVRIDGLYTKIFPMGFKRISFEQIKLCYPRQYSPIGEYGGWGVRYSRKNGKALNMRGNMGVQLEMADGKKLLIGSQKANELSEIINTAMEV